MIPYNLKKIKALVFDVDGVLSTSCVHLKNNGVPCRTANIKDGYAIQLAVKAGFKMAIITGGKSEMIKERYNALGIIDIFMGVEKKIDRFIEWCKLKSLSYDEVLYMGDDIPDYEVMKLCGCPVSPKDACSEIKKISFYISKRNGGEGCVRDIIEQVLKAQEIWMNSNIAFGW